MKILKSSGEELRSWGTLGEHRIVSFSEAIPKDAKLEVFLATETSVMKVPFEFNDVYLPLLHTLPCAKESTNVI